MQKMSELAALGFSSLEEYLASDQLLSEGGFGTTLQCEQAGRVRLYLSQAKRALPYHYLLLVPSGAGRTLVLPGTLEAEGVCFDLNEVAEELFQGCGDWVCRVAMGDEREFFVSRVRQKGEPASQPPVPPQEPEPEPVAPVQEEKRRPGGLGRFRSLFGGKKPEPEAVPAPTAREPEPVSPLQLWADSKRLVDTRLRAQVQGRVQGLVFKANAERRTVGLVRVPEAELRPLLAGQVFHRCPVPEEQHPFRFSIVMAVYNVAPYLEEAVESVLKQDLGFEENVQLILVNDGSTDDSGVICNRYATRYPKNVVVLHQENAGVASARNAGLDRATGSFVNFMDPDDRLSPNALSAVSRLLARCGDEADVFAIPMHFFEAQVGPYWQNYKFDRGTRVIDLWREPLVSDMSASSSFFRLSSLNGLRFPPLRQGEDILFVTQVLLQKMRLGVVADAVYWYRRRESADSRVNTASTHLDWYTDCVRALYQGLLDLGRQRFGCVPDFVSNTLMMDLRWRFKARPEPEGGLTGEQRAAYRQAIAQVLSHIDDRMLLSQRKLPLPDLFQMLELKYGGAPALVKSASDLHAVAQGQRLFSCSELPVTLERITLDAEELTLEGYVRLPAALAQDLGEQYLLSGRDYYRCQRVSRRAEAMDNSFGPVARERGFRVTLPLHQRYSGKPLQLLTLLKGVPVLHRAYNYERSTAFYGRLKEQYLWCPGYVLHGERTHLRLDATQQDRAAFEARYLASLEARLAPDRASQPLLPKELTAQRLALVKRLRAVEPDTPRPVWLLCDDLDRAEGPCAALFRRLAGEASLPVCYVLRQDSPDFARMSEIGTVLAYGSEAHLRAHMGAAALVFSREREAVFSPFTGGQEGYGLRPYLADLLSGQRWVYLRAGAEEADAETWEVKQARHYPREEVLIRSEAELDAFAETVIKN